MKTFVKDTEKMSEHELRRELEVTRRIIDDIHEMTKDNESNDIIYQIALYCRREMPQMSEAEADFEGLFHDWATLLDAIEMALGDEAVFDQAHKLVKGRFAIAEKYGLTIEFTGMPASGEKH